MGNFSIVFFFIGGFFLMGAMGFYFGITVEGVFFVEVGAMGFILELRWIRVGRGALLAG